MRPGLSSVFFLVAFSCCLRAQQPAAPAATGSVTGRVLFADTRLPARMASVVLQPVVDLTSPALDTDSKTSKSEPNTTIVQTLLDGSFAIANVRPGDYYVIAEKLGYLSPLAQLSRDDLNHPSKETADLMAALLTPVRVNANRTATVEVNLLRGATIGGSIRFDDGTPATNTGVALLRKDKSGRWASFHTKQLAGSGGGTATDDLGHFRMSGLPAGVYLLKTTLELADVMVNHIFRENGSSYFSTRYSLDIYFGNVVRQKDAKTIKVAEGEDSGINEIEVPLARLHTVTGTVIEAGSGRTVNAANLSLHYADDDTQVVSTPVRSEDDAFHFLYVPEGEYTLKVTNARDVIREEAPTCPGCLPSTRTVEKTVRSFGDAEQSIVIHTDITGVTIAVPAKASTGAGSAHP
jgi:hypothetical protein